MQNIKIIIKLYVLYNKKCKIDLIKVNILVLLKIYIMKNIQFHLLYNKYKNIK